MRLKFNRNPKPMGPRQKLFAQSLFILMVLSIPFTFVHEAGHAMVCAAQGIRYSMQIELTGGHTQCTDLPQPPQLYHVMGGVFAGLVATGIAFVRFMPLKIAALTLAANNFFAAVVETMAHDLYITNPPVIVAMNAASFLIFIGVLYSIGFNKMPKIETAKT